MDASELLKRYAAGKRDFRGAELRGANLRDANLSRVNLIGANLLGAELRGANLRDAKLSRADLHCADLIGADLIGAQLRGANLHCADLRGAKLIVADLSDANLSFAKLRRANLSDADLYAANLIDAELGGAALSRANLDFAILSEANLYKANLNGASLSCSNLAYSHLNKADLRNADLSNANLFKADLTDANLDGAILKAEIDFADKIAELSKNVSKISPFIVDEEQTKLALILPFIKIINYDIHHPREVVPEYPATFAKKKSGRSEQVDYALKIRDKPVIFIEAKAKNDKELEDHKGQLRYYFNSSVDTNFAIITNGLEYRFFTDKHHPNIMDKQPFFVFHIFNHSSEDIELLELFCRNKFDLEVINSKFNL